MHAEGARDLLHVEHVADLVEGQVAVLMEVGSEKYRYVTGQTIAVRWDGRVVHLSLNDIYEKAAREFGVDVKSITPAEY